MAVPKSKRSKCICKKRRSLQIIEKINNLHLNSQFRINVKKYTNKNSIINFFNHYYFFKKFENKNFKKKLFFKKHNQFKIIY